MTISNEFWQEIVISDEDLNEIYNHLLEIETPLDKFALSKFFIEKKITEYIQTKQAALDSLGQSYLPEKKFSVGDSLVFTALDNKSGRVISSRAGNNPDFSDLQVIDVEFEGSEIRSFASNLPNHMLNNPVSVNNAQLLDKEYVYHTFGDKIAESLSKVLLDNDDVVCIARHYFPRALLFDINIGHLNLCEAVLEMNGGGPLSTDELIRQIELPVGNNPNLSEFSLNFSLENDGRFDEVGPTGITLWFLKRLEPAEVQSVPQTLVYLHTLPEKRQELEGYTELNRLIDDELEDCEIEAETDSISLSLSYPHWRAGTLPLTLRIKSLFPTAYETPRVKFLFVDGNSNTKFSGWVVRPSKYVFGLRDWYEQQGTMPGSLVTIRKSSNPEEVIIQTTKNKNSRDWIRTILIGADGGIVFALLKQVITCTFDDRMAVYVPDISAVDAIWSNLNRQKMPIEKTIFNVMRELGKLNSQNQIHAQELYSATNLLRRVPPSMILQTLHTQSWSGHLGDLYFNFFENISHE